MYNLDGQFCGDILGDAIKVLAGESGEVDADVLAGECLLDERPDGPSGGAGDGNRNRMTSLEGYDCLAASQVWRRSSQIGECHG
jgi:hypothetical protein